MQPSETNPKIVVQLGVFRSASTWAANVLADILRPLGPVRIVADDDAAPMPDPRGLDGRVVIKVNRPSTVLAPLLEAKTPLVVTIREPLDCVASMMLQLREPFDLACSKISRSCHCVLQAVERGSPLVLRYEDGRRDATTVRAMAQAIGVTDVDAEAIAARHTPERVNAFIETLISEGAFGEDPSPHDMDPETLWHPHHLGSGEAGRFRDILSPFEMAAVIDITGEFRDRFGYKAHTRAARDWALR